MPVAPRFGAHLSTAGGLPAMLERARTLGCTCVQIFAGNPRSWQGVPVPARSAAAYRRLAPSHGVEQLFIHAVYLVNLASPDARTRRRSIACVRRDLESARRLGAAALIVHPGSDLGVPGGWDRLRLALIALRPFIPAPVRLLLEGMAATRNTLGDIRRLGHLARELGPCFGICLDTAHLCAGGYALHRPEGFDRLVRDLRRHVGSSRVGCVHVNDAVYPCGTARDRHANLGEGTITPAGFRRLLGHPMFRRASLILETPGFAGQGPDAENLRRLKAYALSRNLAGHAASRAHRR